MLRHWIFLAFLSLLLAGCGSLDLAQPTIPPQFATQPPSLTPPPRFVGTATPTPPPTNTPRPTPTPPPTQNPRTNRTTTPTHSPPKVMERYMEGVALLNVQTFDQTTTAETLLNGSVDALGEYLIIEAGEDNPLAEGANTLTGGQGVLFLFRYKEDTEFNITYSHGRGGPPVSGSLSLALRRGRLTFAGREGDIRYGEGLVGNLALEYGKWFGVALGVDAQGTGVVVVWDYENPARSARNRFYFSQPGENWSLRLSVSQSTLWVDNYAEFSFDTVR